MLLGILVGLGIFAALNWTAVSAPTDLNLLFRRVEAPLGVILLGVTAAVTVLYIAFLAWLETVALLEARRTARELNAQRELAQRAEASRYSELREFLAAELASRDRAARRHRADRQHAGRVHRRARGASRPRRSLRLAGRSAFTLGVARAWTAGDGCGRLQVPCATPTP
jgi:uncharacterized integral membrane protein